MARDAVERDGLAVADRLRGAGEILAIAQPHDVERFLRRQHRAMAGARMVGMAMRDQGLVDRPGRVDMKAAGLAADAGRRRQTAGLRDASVLDRLCADKSRPLRTVMQPLSTLFQSSGDLIADRRYEMARDCEASGDSRGAVDLLEQTVERAPGFAAAWFDSRRIARKDRRPRRRGGGLRQARAADPPTGTARGLRLRLSISADITAMSADYVRSVFDQYASKFDDALGRRSPIGAGECCVDAVGSRVPERRTAACSFGTMLDLGCGTGLVGRGVPAHRRLDGGRRPVARHDRAGAARKLL